MAVRIKDLTTTATEAANDDYIAIDGATNGTRKILANNVSKVEYDFETTLTPSINANGVTSNAYSITPAFAANATNENLLKIKAYLKDSNTIYPLIVGYAYTLSNGFFVSVKSINESTQGTGSTVSGTLHIVAPFEINSVATSM